jgi:tetratricopeptide (TPR) repeat protein
MSLINEALRNLDERQTTDKTPEAVAMRGFAPPSRPHGLLRWSRRALWLCLLAGLGWSVFQIPHPAAVALRGDLLFGVDALWARWVPGQVRELVQPVTPAADIARTPLPAQSARLPAPVVSQVLQPAPSDNKAAPPAPPAPLAIAASTPPPITDGGAVLTVATVLAQGAVRPVARNALESALSARVAESTVASSQVSTPGPGLTATVAAQSSPVVRVSNSLALAMAKLEPGALEASESPAAGTLERPAGAPAQVVGQLRDETSQIAARRGNAPLTRTSLEHTVPAAALGALPKQENLLMAGANTRAEAPVTSTAVVARVPDMTLAMPVWVSSQSGQLRSVELPGTAGLDGATVVQKPSTPAPVPDSPMANVLPVAHVGPPDDLTTGRPSRAALEPVLRTVTAPTRPAEPISMASLEGDGLTPDELQRLLRNAQLALENNRLTLPIGRSAYDYYQAILRRAPDNEVAARGLSQLPEQYERLILEQMERGERQRARFFLDRYTSFGWTPSDRLVRAISDLGAQAPERQRSVVPVADPPARSTASSMTPAQDQPLLGLERLRALVADKGVKVGIDALEKASANAGLQLPRAHTDYLIDLHISAGNASKALTLLRTASARNRSMHFMWSKYYHRFEGSQAAMAYLESQTPTDEKALAYLAALYQKAGVHQRALALYGELLTTDGSNGIYLLGYAIAADSSGAQVAAREAYQRALVAGPHHATTTSFIRERLTTLQ